jgi:hypothetical protein
MTRRMDPRRACTGSTMPTDADLPRGARRRRRRANGYQPGKVPCYPTRLDIDASLKVVASPSISVLPTV